VGADRDALVTHLQQSNIPCGVYYPIPLHLQKAYADSRYKEEDFVVTNQLINQVISLPMHSELDEEQIQLICSQIVAFLD
jgi:dTDP-4-amino-4,6-dideoxygalactose transaminase